MPTNIEGLKALASNVSQEGNATLPERDSFYEIVFTHKFNFGLIAKTAAYYKYSSPGLDDESIGSSAVKTPVNLAVVNTTGLELSLSYEHPKIPMGFFVNTALIHAYGSGAITGGFLPIHDNGKGIASVSERQSKGQGFGLTGMSERARMLGGKFVVHSIAEQGTRIEVKLSIERVRHE